jgi:hypothetical protein
MQVADDEIQAEIQAEIQRRKTQTNAQPTHMAAN